MLRERLTAQLLAGSPAADAVAVAERLLAVQAQDLRAAQLAIRSRTAGLRVADVDRALTDDRSLLVTWLNRGTLHLVRAEDYPWLHALTAPGLVTANARRLADEGVSAAAAERGAAVIERALAEEGPLTREALRTRLDAAGVPTARQALNHVLLFTSLRGTIVRGPMAGAQQAFVLVRDWLGEDPSKPVDRDAALAELARRFLAGHGPATDRDLAKWAGVGLRDARAGLAAIAAQLDRRPDGTVDLAGRPPPEPLPGPRLLGGFEPLLMGWVDRAPVLGGHTSLITVNGIFRPLVLVRGRVVGTWGLDGDALAVELPQDGVRVRDRAALAAEEADVLRFLARD